MSMQNDLANLLKKAGGGSTAPEDTRRVGFYKDFKPIKDKRKDKDDDDKKTKGGPLDIGPLQEYHDPQSRNQAIIGQNEDKGLKLIFQWTKTGTIDFDEFEDLLAEIVKKIRPRL